MGRGHGGHACPPWKAENAPQLCRASCGEGGGAELDCSASYANRKASRIPSLPAELPRIGIATREVVMPARAQQPSLVELLKLDPNYLKQYKDHPIQAQLYERAVKQIDVFQKLLASYSAGKVSSETLLSEFKSWWPRFILTISWVAGDIQQAEATPPTLQELLSYGWTDQLAVKYLSQFGKRGRGRPVTKRQLAVKALEMRERDPNWSWAKLAIKFSISKDAIRREVTRLKAFLQQ